MRRFFLLFLPIQLLLFILAGLREVQQHLLAPWTPLLAKASAALVMVFDSSVAAQGNVLWNATTGFGVAIEAGCNGVEAYIVLIAAICAFPSSWRMKVWGLAWGFVAVQSLNLVRVISLFYLGQWNTSVFHFAHTYLWQGLIMLDVLGFWLYWITLCARAQRTDASTALHSA